MHVCIIGQRTYSLLIRISSTMYECIYLEDLFRPKLNVKRDSNILTTSVVNALRILPVLADLVHIRPYPDPTC
jgi:hypothetical protein